MSSLLVMRQQDWLVSAGLHALVLVLVLGSSALLSLSPPAEPVHRLDLPLQWSEIQPASPEAPQPPRPPVKPTAKPTQQPSPPAPQRPAPAVPEQAPVPQTLAPAAVPYAATPDAVPQAAFAPTVTTPHTLSSATSTTAMAQPSTMAPDPATERRWQAQLEALLARDRHYPMQARRAGQEGTVTVEAHFAADGQLLRCAVQIGSGFRALDEAAVLMVRRAAEAARALINPGRSAQLRIPITFHLEES
jgi:protein TonB